MYTFVVLSHRRLVQKTQITSSIMTGSRHRIRMLPRYTITPRQSGIGEIYAGHLSASVLAALPAHLGEFGMQGKGPLAFVDLHSAISSPALPAELRQLYAEALHLRFEWLWVTC
jgi:hypothetical protein